VYELAQRLAERESDEGVGLPFHRAIASLRLALESMVGPNGADAMVYRAIFLTRRELGLVSEGREQRRRLRESLTEQDGPKGALFTEKVMAHLLWLVMEFIGEDLTLSFVRQTWPDIQLSSAGDDADEKSNA
jgi:hypothetical protein